MRELTENEKTILELFNTNGRAGVHQYLVFQGMTDDEAELHIDSLDYLPTFIPTKVIDATVEASTDAPQNETVTVTFADGSTREIEVAPDGSVISPSLVTEKKTVDLTNQATQESGVE